MSRSFLLFNHVTFSYDSAERPLFEAVELTFPNGWTGVVGANGTGKSTLLLLAARKLRPLDGTVRTPGAATLCEQRTDEMPPVLPDLLASAGSDASALRGKLSLEADWPGRWETLSHGERKRAQLGVALWRDDPVLCLDEPTNHVDADTRRLLASALAGYRGIGLLVSHDRDLLDSLCRQCLFLDPPRIVMRPGSWSAGREQERLEDESLRRDAQLARAEVRAITRRVAQAKEEARRAKKRLSKRRIDRHDIDARRRMDLARMTGKDSVSARLNRRLSAKLDRASARAEAIRPRPVRELGLWFSSEPSRRDALLALPAGRLPLGPDAYLRWPDLVLRPRDRVALTGPNGFGKSTLIRHIAAQLRAEPDRLLLLPQETGRQEGAALLNALRGMPDVRLGRALTVVNLLGTDPKRLLASREPSPGEVRKILIAMGISRVPHLIVLDEPTNHLDLPSIECLEEALAECRCALLLASHDERFLARLTSIRWSIGAGHAPGERLLEVSGTA